MNYKYRLVENIGDDSGDNKDRGTYNLILYAKNENYPLDAILDILDNPKDEYLKGAYAPSSESEKEIKLNVYGEKNVLANIDKNKELKNKQVEKYGKLFYKHIEDELGAAGKPSKFERILNDPKKDNIGKAGSEGFLLGLPLMTKNNNDIIAQYTKLTKSKGKTSGIKYKQLPDEPAVKILTPNMSITEKNINTILTNAGLKAGVDYSLTRVKDEGLLREIIKEIITRKNIKK